jgi:hypothetical protein
MKYSSIKNITYCNESIYIEKYFLNEVNMK